MMEYYGSTCRLRGGHNRKTAGSRVFVADTVRGCTVGCIGCFARSTAVRRKKIFDKPVPCRLVGRDPSDSGECVVRIGTSGDPGFMWTHSFSEYMSLRHAFLWTSMPHPIPEEFHGADFNYAVTIDVNRKGWRRVIRNMVKGCLPKRTLVVIRTYQGNRTMMGLAYKAKKMVMEHGYRSISIPVRLTKKEAASIGSVPSSALDYSKGANLDQFVCGSLGNGKCADCNYCYRFFVSKKAVRNA